MRTKTLAMRTKSLIVVTWSLAALASLLPAPAKAQPGELDRIDAAIEKIRTEIGIPGLAVAIVRDDSVLLARGYGVREAGRPERVDAHTLFAIGSATKAFTATALAVAVEETGLGWDDPVVERLPGFALHDPYVTAEITLRDLLAHRSGLPTANLMWYSTPADSDTLLRRLRHLQPVAGFRASFTYQNLLYLAAGRILEEATGRRWDAFLEDRIFAPLGMERTNASMDSLAGRVNVATPHVRLEDRTVPVPYRNLDDVAPAGSINSSAADLARWLRFLLADGRVAGEALIDPATLKETRRPQTVVPMNPIWSAFHPTTSRTAYGMGWFISDFHGRTLLDHGGGIDGMSALLALVPEEELGVAIVTNLQTSLPPVWVFGLLYAALDEILDVSPTEWRPGAARLKEVLAASRPEAERVPGTQASLALERFAGRYRSELLGPAEVARQEGGLVFRLGTLEAPLEHWHHDTFRAPWSDPAWRAAAGPGWVTFRLDRHGAVEGFDLEAYPGTIRTFNRVEAPPE